MSFGDRLSETRKKKGLSQEELAKKLGTQGPAIGRYERGIAKPTIEVACKLAEALGVSLDYLTGISDQELDNELVKQINDLQTLHEEERSHILKTLQSLIRDAKTRAAYS